MVEAKGKTGGKEEREDGRRRARKVLVAGRQTAGVAGRSVLEPGMLAALQQSKVSQYMVPSCLLTGDWGGRLHAILL